MPGTLAGKTSKKKTAKRARRTKKTKSDEQIVLEVVAALNEDLKALQLTPHQTEEFITRFGQHATKLDNPVMVAVYKEMEVRRRMASSTNSKPGIISRVGRKLSAGVGAVVTGVKGLASSVAGLFKREPKRDWSKPHEEWSLPMLRQKLEELGVTPPEPKTITVQLR